MTSYTNKRDSVITRGDATTFSFSYHHEQQQQGQKSTALFGNTTVPKPGILPVGNSFTEDTTGEYTVINGFLPSPKPLPTQDSSGGLIPPPIPIPAPFAHVTGKITYSLTKNAVIGDVSGDGLPDFAVHTDSFTATQYNTTSEYFTAQSNALLLSNGVTIPINIEGSSSLGQADTDTLSPLKIEYTPFTYLGTIGGYVTVRPLTEHPTVINPVYII